MTTHTNTQSGTPRGNLKFPTADEAAYPLLLCKRVLALILDYAIMLGAENPDTLKRQLPSGSTTSHRWILDMLPKGKKLKLLVSEFQSCKQFLNGPDQDRETAGIFRATTQRFTNCSTTYAMGDSVGL